MRWVPVLAALCCLIAASPLSAAVRREGQAWVLENGSLKVTVEQEAARMAVLHKATGVLWQQEAPLRGGDAEQQIEVRRVGAPPEIDGDGKDWTRDGVIWLPWVGEDGESNLSGGAYVRWDRANLYLYVRVRDQAVAFGREEPQQWWEADSVEFWVDGVQVGLHLCPGALAAVDAGGRPYEGARLAVWLIEGGSLPGYGVELAMPVEHFPALKDPEAGVRFYFAVGLNDADPEPGQPVRRVAQGYYPRTWVHLQPTTFAVAVLTDEEGHAPPLTKQNDRTGVLSAGGASEVTGDADANVVRYRLNALRGQAEPLPLEVALALVGDEPALDITLSCEKGGGAPMSRLEHPERVFPPDPERYFLALADYSDGHYVPVGDERYRAGWFSCYGSLDMPWVAVTDGKQGMMVIAMTPADAVIRMGSRRGDDAKLGFPGLLWEPSKGTWGGDRKIRLAFFERGGHVAACKIYRKLAQEAGYFRTLADKAADNPDVPKLMGAVDWWGADGLRFVKEAIAAGMDHGLVNGRWAPDDMAEMVRLGWLVGEYDNYVDIDDAPEIAPHKAPVAEHAIVKADGELMTAWVSRDADMNPTHTFMKHCTAKQLECARAIIPGVLEKYPYNTRFLDVTSAEWLLECYSPDHPTTRSSDMANRQRLQRYVSEELGLVAGGEHGRFWSVPQLHYHEGMMGGGRYSWPAGYLRDVKDRSELSEDYLKYGINPAHRVPLFELVYHDCVVDYWYWGACSDYLHQVAPEITERKTAMNVLYGTPPMMWVRSHGLRWHVPEEREQMLAIYRNVCKLHEVIGMQEMVSHEFLTPDRMVQRTEFADGTTCTVNFGKAPHAVRTRAGGILDLGENDFYAAGPEIEQWRAPIAMPDRRGATTRQTVIRRRDYLFVDSGEGRYEDEVLKCTGQVTLRRAADLRGTIRLGAGAALVLDVPAWQPAWGALPRVLLALDDLGNPASRVAGGDGSPLRIEGAPEAEHTYLLLAGDEALVADATIADVTLSVAGRPVEPETELRPGETMSAMVLLRNDGLAAARDLGLTLNIDGPEGLEIGGFDGIGLAAGAERSLGVQFPVAVADGPRQVVARLTGSGDLSLTGRTLATAAFTGPADPERFAFKRRFVLEVPAGDAAGMAVELALELTGGSGRAPDPKNLRVLFEDGTVVPAQFEPARAGAGEGTLVLCLPSSLASGGEAHFTVLGAAAGPDAPARHVARFQASEDGSRIRMSAYTAGIGDGVLHSIAVRTPGGEQPVIERIILSSAETGWSSEEGDVEHFARVACGPVRAVYECTKVLRDTYRLTRRWDFYADRFEVRSRIEPHLNTLTRARYSSPGTATNETGRSAAMDGQGDAEGFGFQGTPGWYAVYSDRYRTACIALTPPSGFTYWDNGGLGQISLNHGGDGAERRLYLLGPGGGDDGFARAAAEAYAQGVRVRPAP